MQVDNKSLEHIVIDNLNNETPTQYLKRMGTNFAFLQNCMRLNPSDIDNIPINERIVLAWKLLYLATEQYYIDMYSELRAEYGNLLHEIPLFAEDEPEENLRAWVCFGCDNIKRQEYEACKTCNNNMEKIKKEREAENDERN